MGVAQHRCADEGAGLSICGRVALQGFDRSIMNCARMTWAAGAHGSRNRPRQKRRRGRRRGQAPRGQVSCWRRTGTGLHSSPGSDWAHAPASAGRPASEDWVLRPQQGGLARGLAGWAAADRACLDPLQPPCSAWQPPALCGPPSPGRPPPAAACACRRGPRYIRHRDRVHRRGRAARSAAPGAQRFPLPCSQVALRSSSLAGLRLEQQGAAAKAQRRAAVVVAAAEGEAQQLDPLERRAAAGWVPV